MREEIITVSQYLDRVNTLLKKEKSKIKGEISGIQEYPGRSYMYFSIKDSEDQSTVKCFMWKRDFNLSGVELKEGIEVIVSAYPAIYKPNGGLSLQVEIIELLGEGALQIAYEKLKKKLEHEGLFLESRKRVLPSYPHKIGLITSKSGAVINDFLTNIKKFGFEIVFVDSKVEGQDAIKDLLSALEILKNEDLDVLIIMRGGGSLESFQAFNNEILVRKVSDFPAPVLTGIGHDKDLPLVALVSDKNVSTPTAVANLLNSGWDEAIYNVNLFEEKIFSGLSKILEVWRRTENELFSSVQKIQSQILRTSDFISSSTKEIVLNFSSIYEFLDKKLKSFEFALEISNPLKQLKRGYSLVMKKGKLIKKTDDVKSGDSLDIRVIDGIINASVK